MKRQLILSLSGALLTALVGCDGAPSKKSTPEATPKVVEVAKKPIGEKVAKEGVATSLHTLKGHKSFVGDVAWSPDGGKLASCAGTKVWIWDAANGKELRTLKGHEGLVTEVAWSQDGSRLAIGGSDETVQIWSIPK